MSSFDINVEKIGEVEGESRFEMSFSSPVLYKGDHTIGWVLMEVWEYLI
jgi:hypothetical protein